MLECCIAMGYPIDVSDELRARFKERDELMAYVDKMKQLAQEMARHLDGPT